MNMLSIPGATALPQVGSRVYRTARRTVGRSRSTHVARARCVSASTGVAFALRLATHQTRPPVFRFLLLGLLLPLSLSTASAQITVAPDSLIIALEAGDTGVLSFDITNTGSDPAGYSLGFRRAATPPAARNAGQRSGSTGSGGVQAPYLDGPPAFVAPSLALLPPARGRQMNGRLFGASEGTQTIAEFDPLTGAVLASIPSPPTASGAGRPRVRRHVALLLRPVCFL